MKDVDGNDVFTGDVVLEIRGCGYDKDIGRYTSAKLWKIPSKRDGSGYTYTSDGKRTWFKWADYKKAKKVDFSLMPEGFEYSFLHGMSDIDFTGDFSGCSVADIVARSDWEKNRKTPEDTGRFDALKALKLESMEDIERNIDFLFQYGPVPNSVVDSVLSIAKVRQPQLVNGELGIMAFQTMVLYSSILKKIKDERRS